MDIQEFFYIIYSFFFFKFYFTIYILVRKILLSKLENFIDYSQNLIVYFNK